MAEERGLLNSLYILDTSCFDDRDMFEKAEKMVDDKRREKTAKLKQFRDKCLCLGAGVLFNHAMKIAGINDFKTALSEHGKPYLPGRGDVFFNISHSGRMVIVGVSDREIGVDIEKVRHFNDSLKNYVFSEGDLRLSELIEEKYSFEAEGEVSSSDIALTRLWTVKESIMKHSGLGISLEPKKIRLKGIEEGSGLTIIAQSDNYDCEDLKITCYSLSGYQISVCSFYRDFKEPEEVR